MQGEKALPSSAHWKLDPASLEVKEKLGEVELVGLAGPEVIVVSGGVRSIVQLNEFIQGRNVDLWPRIDKVPGCPDELKQMVIRTVAGT